MRRPNHACTRLPIRAVRNKSNRVIIVVQGKRRSSHPGQRVMLPLGCTMSYCIHYLFLDTDTCFIQDDTLDTMLRELEQDSIAFSIAPRLSSNGDTEIEEKYWEKAYDYRLHPCCALVKNTLVFRRVVEVVGLSCVQYLWAKGEEYLDTFKLMSMVMKTHGCRHILSSKMVLYFFSVSYDREPQHVMEYKAGLRDRLLEELRNPETS